MPTSQQPAPRAALRFDVDTHQCMHRGVPRLLELADEFQIPMTFFINMGRAVSYPGLARNLLAPGSRAESQAEPATKLSSVEKLGFTGTLYTLLANPRVGLSSGLLPEIESRGHEIGLHGGRNHASWQNHAHAWTQDQLDREIQWGLRALKNAGVRSVDSFASPGWTSPALLPGLLADNGLTVLADHHSRDHDARGLLEAHSPVRSVNTNLLGEPAGVGYLEYCQARRLGFTEMACEVEQVISSFADVLMYDHPAYAGGNGLARLKALIATLKHHNSHFLTVEEMARTSAQS